ncbi:ATP synthase subunit I [Solimicrobium silvestre]|uniref:F1/F0 ATPase, Methanosarcina type, subunit 2 n=1 Tax=Solimicrobium silvestre TaxID=2099400 RepID=A0A2S9GW57_9BURK|nr:ATP synthase subunit I [Solimicrobium silvestre]PRC91928.1 F1/F0 ATPase, Methanosarcina type, subunit 2 [Solimicrobium silvestre]
MNDFINLAGAFAVGIVIGALFFGGLWWTTLKGVVSDNPALWFFGSLLLRTVGMLVGLHLVAGDDWHRAIVCLLGFIVARFAVLRFFHVRQLRLPPSLDASEEQ